MHSNGNTSSVIFHRGGSVCLKRNLYGAAVPCKMLIHRIVHDLIKTMIKSLDPCGAYIHSGTQPYRFQPLQYGDTLRSVIILCISHKKPNLAFNIWL